MNLLSTVLATALLTTTLAVAETQPVTVTVIDDGKSPELAPRFIGNTSVLMIS